MIIKDLNKVFKTLDGRDMTINIVDDEQGSLGGQKVTKKNMTLREVMTNSILAPQQNTQNPRGEQMDGAEKARRYYLAMEIHKSKKQIELNVDDVKLIKDEIGRVYPPLIVGQAFEILDPPKGSVS